MPFRYWATISFAYFSFARSSARVRNHTMYMYSWYIYRYVSCYCHSHHKYENSQAMKIGKYQISKSFFMCVCETLSPSVCVSGCEQFDGSTVVRSSALTLLLTHFISPHTYTHTLKLFGINWRLGFYHKAISYYVYAVCALAGLVFVVMTVILWAWRNINGPNHLHLVRRVNAGS